MLTLRSISLYGSAFNSLYEIHEEGMARGQPVPWTFQFSLWDSWWYYHGCGHVCQFYFQFSLWDSFVFIKHKTVTCYVLSILFMRFLLIITPRDANVVALSILFMRFLEGLLRRCRRLHRYFQFSLWDSKKFVIVAYTPEGRAFNSLYEILHLSIVGTLMKGGLSILFMRFTWAYG